MLYHTLGMQWKVSQIIKTQIEKLGQKNMKFELVMDLVCF